MEGLLALIVVALIGNLVVLGAILIPWLRTSSKADDDLTTGADLEGRLAAAAVTGGFGDDPDGGGSTQA